MKLCAGWVVPAGLLLVTAANAGGLAPNEASRPHSGLPVLQVSDIGGPYAELPAPPVLPRYARALLPAQEVYTVLRDGGFSPRGAPRLRGDVWVISAIDRSGDDGRLFIDARDGRILSFMPSYRTGDRYGDDPPAVYAAPADPVPMPGSRGFPRPPGSIPRVASRAVPAPQPVTPLPPMPMPVPPMPKAAPAAAEKPVTPAPPQAVAVESKPLPAPAAPPPAAAAMTTGQVKPAPQILPTQEMPKAQGLEY